MGLQIRNTSEYKSISLREAFQYLEVSEVGLTDSQVDERLKVFGPNKITEKKPNPLVEFMLRYWGPMPWLLELAMMLSLMLHHNLEGCIIFGLLTVNAIIGQWHARGSQKAVELLKKKLAVNTRVLRNGRMAPQDAQEIVPGDIVLVKLGDIVPADAKIIGGDLSVDTSSLTGESLPVSLHSSDIIYAGSVVKKGEAKAVVVNTAVNTYFGKTVELVKIAKSKSTQEQVMLSVVKYMMYVGIAAAVLVAVYAFYIHAPVLQVMTFVVIFLMGAVPVALPAVMTIVQSVGAMELVQKGVLVTKLDSIEDAASVDILCLDKTGTITMNQLSVTDAVALSGYKMEDLSLLAAFACQTQGPDSIDMAINEYAKSKGVDLSKFKQITYTPFDPSIKRTEATVELDGKRYRIIKGATQVVMALCPKLDPMTRQGAEAAIKDFTQRGYRTIAVAQAALESPDNFQLAGVLALADPPRPDALNMIKELEGLGIKPMMLTGDALPIAREIAMRVGIGENIIRWTDIEHLKQEEQVQAMRHINGLAEIFPENKYQIVKLLQSAGHMVGMTGDGVNDAPALKQAEIGIAVSNATDVAKASAGIVLTKPGISIIIDTVKMSRQIYQRMLTWVINKITKVIEFVGLLTVTYFWFQNMAITLLGVSLLVFANDFVTMSLATDNAHGTGSPNEWDVKKITSAALVPGLLLIVEDIIVVLVGLNYFHLHWGHLQSLLLLNLVFNSQFRVMIVRERGHFWSSLPGRELLIFSIGAIACYALLGVYGILIPAVKAQQILVVLALSAIFMACIDFPKCFLFKRFKL